MGNRLAGKRVFITQSNAYMGPAIEALFSGEGAVVSAKPGKVPFGPDFTEFVTGQDDIDILIANLAHDPCNSPVAEIHDDNWQSLFDTMVHPLMNLIRHFASEVDPGNQDGQSQSTVLHVPPKMRPSAGQSQIQ